MKSKNEIAGALFIIQARGFYEPLGYTVFGTFEDYPPGHSRFFLKGRRFREGQIATDWQTWKFGERFCGGVRHYRVWLLTSGGRRGCPRFVFRVGLELRCFC